MSFTKRFVSLTLGVPITTPNRISSKNMNPLCCIAPVSINRDRANPLVAKSAIHSQLDSSIRTTVNHNSKLSFSAQVSCGFDKYSSIGSQEIDESKVYSVNGRVSVAGILYKWVNYGKGWRSRWFMLEDGVLSYYKIHGPDKILTSPAGRDKGVRVIGEDSLRYMRKVNWRSLSGGGGANNRLSQCRPFGEIHLKVSSVRASKSDDKRLTIFTGTKTLHLHCISRKDRAAWLEALQSAKDLFPREFTSSDFSPSEDVFISTEKLRSRLVQEGVGETVIKECESIMLSEVSELQNKLKALQHKHIMLLDTMRQLETEKIELEATVVDEMKERDSYCGQANRTFSDFYSVMSEAIASDSDADNESQDGADVESDENDGLFFDTNDFLSTDALRSSSYRSRAATGNTDIYDEDPFLSDHLRGFEKEIRTVQYPYVKRRDILPEPKEKEKHVGLWSIIKENIGKDLSGVCLPVYFNEPLSSLQKCFEDLEYSYLVDQALEWGKQGNDLMRILNVAAFAVSGYASTEGKSPPMVVACHCEGRGWKFWADSNLKGKFWGRSIQLDPVGVLTLQFEDGETFQWSKVTTSIHNIILGTLKALMALSLGPGSSATFLLVEVVECRVAAEKLWFEILNSRLRPDQRHLENGEYELANSEKFRLEQLQRQASKLQERGWQPRWFWKDEDGCYCYKGGYWETRERKNWDEIPDIFGQSADSSSGLVEE
ncbi:hypothetical protein D5086_017034 [Populus alba]|uniref:Uncharacterized protein n=1 Tax=Populus alba TaxID=43335 RepID=A0ACC4BVT9_POPAL